MSTKNSDTASAFSASLQRVRRDGAAVFPSVFSQDQIAWARELILENTAFMPNTRPSPTSRHMAGFHRFPTLEPLHLMITENATVRRIMEHLCGAHARTIGLSDITVNRSQQWHKDLLRGEFQRYLGEDISCADWHGTVFKVIVYLQNGTSLKIIPGSHRLDIDLVSDESAIPVDESSVVPLPVSAGDAVVIDICTTHRGSAEAAFATLEAGKEPKILVSTVFGRHGAILTDRMELGNAARLNSWMSKHLGASRPAFN